MAVKRTIATGVLITVIIAFGIAFYWFNKPHVGVNKKVPDVTINALTLYNAYQQNEIAADSNYLNKVIEVSGNISSVDYISGSTVVFLGSQDAMGGVSCRFMKDSSSVEIEKYKGSMVKIKGRCIGFLMDVNLVDCIMIK